MPRRTLLAVAFLLLAGLAAWLSLARKPVAPTPAGPAAAPQQPVRSAGAPALGSDAVPQRHGAAPAQPEPPAEPTALARYPGERPLGALLVRVVAAGEDPLPDARVELEPVLGAFPPGLEIGDDRELRAQARTDPQAYAGFADLPAGAYRVSARTEDGRHADQETVVRGGENRLQIQVDGPESARDFVVLIVDTGDAPVSGAHVHVTGGVQGRGVAGGGRLAPLQGTTGADGKVTFPETPMSGAVATATVPDGRTGWASLWNVGNVAGAMSAGGLKVTVASPGQLEGRLLGLDAAELGDAVVRAHALNNQHPHYTTYGRHWQTPVRDGRYRFEALPAGSFALELAGSARLALPPMQFGDFALPNSVQPLLAEVRAGALTVLDLPVARGAAIAGVVRRADGRPVAGAEIRTTFAPSTSNFPDGFTLHGVHVWRLDSDSRTEGDHPVSHPRARTDAAGRYHLGGLQPGRHRVEVYASGLSFDRREALEVAESQTLELEHVLEPSGVLAGVGRWGYLGVTRAGAQEPLLLAILPSNGSFSFPGLAPGRYELAEYHSDASIGRIPLVEAEVHAGRTTWVDLLSARRPITLQGRVLGPAGPLAGVRVRRSDQWATTDAAGVFQFTSSFPLTYRVSFTVLHGGVEFAFDLPGMAQGSTTWTGDLVLGAHTLQVSTLDSRGLPAPARIHLHGGGGPQNASGSGLRSDATGLLQLECLWAGPYTLEAQFHNGARAQAQVQVPERSFIELRAPSAGSIELQVADARGQPQAGWQAEALTWIASEPAPEDHEQWSGASAAYSSATTDAQGLARLLGVPAGEVLVILRRSRGFLSAEAPVHTWRLLLAEHETRSLSLTLP